MRDAYGRSAHQPPEPIYPISPKRQRTSNDVDIELSGDVYSLLLYCERSQKPEVQEKIKPYRMRIWILTSAVCLLQIAIGISAMIYQGQKVDKTLKKCGWLSRECSKSSACKNVGHSTLWASVFYIITGIALSPDLIPHVGLASEIAWLPMVAQSLTGWTALMASYYVTLGETEFVDLAMNYAALALIAQLDNLTFEGIKHGFCGVPFANALPDKLAITADKSVAKRDTNMRSKLVMMAWLVILGGAVFLQAEACGQKPSGFLRWCFICFFLWLALTLLGDLEIFVSGRTRAD